MSSERRLNPRSIALKVYTLSNYTTDIQFHFIFVIHNRHYKTRSDSEEWTIQRHGQHLTPAHPHPKKKQQNTENQTDDQHGAHQTTGLTLGALEG